MACIHPLAGTGMPRHRKHLTSVCGVAGRGKGFTECNGSSACSSTGRLFWALGAALALCVFS